MPMYEFLCSNEHKTDCFAPMKDYMKPIKCSVCGKTAERVLSLANTDLVENVRKSRTMAMSVVDIKSGRAHEVHPGATFGKPNKAGMCPLVIHNRHEKVKRIKERGKSIGVPLTEM